MARFFTLFSIAVIALASFAQATDNQEGGNSVGNPEDSLRRIHNNDPIKRDPGAEGQDEEGKGKGQVEGQGEGEGEGEGEGDALKKREGGEDETCDDVV